MFATSFRRFLFILPLTLSATFAPQIYHPCLGAPPDKRSPATLLTPVELQPHLADPAWRILDARRSAQYRGGHIPGALRVDIEGWGRRAGQPAGLKDEQFWANAVANLGIDRKMTVVVYADNVATSARVWWLLAYIGVPRVAILDGGWQAWQSAGLPETTETPEVTPVAFPVHFSGRWLVETESPLWSRESAEVQIIDARSRDEYTGARALGGRAGRIPQAIHLDWLDVLDSQWCFKEAGELKKLLQSKGIAPDKRQLVYCYSGARSSVVVFALRRIGYRDVSNYFGGWQQWSATDLPAETGDDSQ